ncbi:hypothetical protein MC885_019192 [Smutsia gigantea]|nr:hypothetical protein MC885_019192 [Smutsia gigantea]
MLLQEACRSAVPGLGDTAGGMAAPRPASAAPADISQMSHLPPSAFHRSSPSPVLLQPLEGAVAQLWRQHQRSSATCATRSGFHDRTFDGCHYHPLLAGAADCTQALHLTPRGHCPQPEPCQLVREGAGDGHRVKLNMGEGETLTASFTSCTPKGQVMMGPNEVLVWGGNAFVSWQLVPDGESRLLHGLSLQWQGGWLVLSGGLGVIVRLDRSRSVSISVDHELQGQTQGLCGVCSGQPEIEAAQGCEDPLRGTEVGVEAGPLHAEAQDVCHQLLDGPFRDYHAQPSRDLCFLSTEPPPERPLCGPLRPQALQGQRGPAGGEEPLRPHSPLLCPGGQLYSACPPSCSAAGEGGEGPCGKACVSGCECAPGLLWDGALCVPAARCPCYHRRRRYAPGNPVRQLCNPCVCQDRRWFCAQAPCPAEWAVGGDGQYLTFDGRSLSFRGLPGCRSGLVQVGKD